MNQGLIRRKEVPVTVVRSHIWALAAVALITGCVTTPTATGDRTKPEASGTIRIQGGEKPSPRTKPLRQLAVLGSGSGFMLDDTGLFVTANHVVEGCERIVIYERRKFRAAHIVARSRDDDLAILRAEKSTTPSLSARAPKLNDRELEADRTTTFAVGFPGGRIRFPTVVRGFVQDTRSLFDFRGGITLKEVLELSTDSPIGNGASGGPLLNRDGQIVGIITARYQVIGNIGYAVPVDRLHALIASADINLAATQPRRSAPSVRLTERSVLSFARPFTIAILCTNG